MLNDSRVEANIPAEDLGRARQFYAKKLGITPTNEVPDIVMMYKTAGGTSFNIYKTEYAGMAQHTIAQWHVDDVEAAVKELKARDVSFETYDLPGVEWNNDIVLSPMGRAAWFKDSEGNTMCLDEGMPGS